MSSTDPLQQGTLFGEFDEWCDFVRDPANESGHVEKIEIKAGCALARCLLTSLPGGKCGINIDLEYNSGNHMSRHNPWKEFPTRGEAIQKFFRLAIRHFGPISPYDSVANEKQRRAQRQMQSKLNKALRDGQHHGD